VEAFLDAVAKIAMTGEEMTGGEGEIPEKVPSAPKESSLIPKESSSAPEESSLISKESLSAPKESPSTPENSPNTSRKQTSKTDPAASPKPSRP
jgi:hypothetical protein